ncbi:DUF2567 domain-containing protein [Catellatospora sp. NPDC049609]|uniref:DUF2567 domain-containing protein n=1 Tax=Catellatospora sp. NPDC049609 TaxID=3155505 RepID=UPI00342A6518
MLSDDTPAYGDPYGEPAHPVTPQPAARGGYGADVLWALVTAAVIGVLGLGLGLLWHALAPELPLRMAELGTERGLVYISGEPEELAAAEGWFVLLGLGFGVLVAVLAWVLLPSRRGPIQLAGVLVGAVIAGWVAWYLGHHIGLAEYERLKTSAPVDSIVHRPPDLRAIKELDFFPYAVGGTLLIPAFGAVVSYALMAAWSRWPSLRREEDEDTYADDGYDDHPLDSPR